MHWNSERQRQMGRHKDWSPLKDSEEVSSVCQSCLILCNTMYCTTPGLPVHLQLTESTQPMSIELWCHLTISSSVIPFASCPQYFPASESLPMSQLFASSAQNIGVSVSTSVFPMNTQDWYPLGWTGWISLLSRDSQESSPAPQFKSTNYCRSAFL